MCRPTMKIEKTSDCFSTVITETLTDFSATFSGVGFRRCGHSKQGRVRSQWTDANCWRQCQSSAESEKCGNVWSLLQLHKGTGNAGISACLSSCFTCISVMLHAGQTCVAYVGMVVFCLPSAGNDKRLRLNHLNRQLDEVYLAAVEISNTW